MRTMRSNEDIAWKIAAREELEALLNDAAKWCNTLVTDRDGLAIEAVLDELSEMKIDPSQRPSYVLESYYRLSLRSQHATHNTDPKNRAFDRKVTLPIGTKIVRVKNTMLPGKSLKTYMFHLPGGRTMEFVYVGGTKYAKGVYRLQRVTGFNSSARRAGSRYIGARSDRSL